MGEKTKMTEELDNVLKEIKNIRIALDDKMMLKIWMIANGYSNLINDLDEDVHGKNEKAIFHLMLKKLESDVEHIKLENMI